MRSLKSIHWLVLAFLVILAIPSASSAQVAVGISVRVGPPVLPIYAQPVIPGPGYLWTPGYWAYGPEAYYWVPGTWVLPPTVGFLWTPGYWGWGNGVYLWHGGYWGPHVGFYGGINYGYGYGGVGFGGGYWRGGAFYYNRSVANVNTTVIHNTYNTTVINNNTTVNRTSFHGGTGGTTARPTTAELAAGRESHVQPTALQTQHQQAASTNRAMLASTNHGQPSVAATAKPGQFKGPGVVPARAASTNPTAAGTANTKNTASVNSRTNAQSSPQAKQSASKAQTTQTTSAQPHSTQPPAAQQHTNRSPAVQSQSHPAPPQSHPAPQQPHPAQPQPHPAQPQSHPAPQQHPPAQHPPEQHPGGKPGR